MEADHHHVTLPRMGRVRTHESTRKLARRLEAGTARILSATVSWAGGRWQCAFQVIVAGGPGPPDARRPIRTSGGGCRCRCQGFARGRHPGRSRSRPHSRVATVDPGAISAARGAPAGRAPVWSLRPSDQDPPGALQTLAAGHRAGAGASMPRWPRSGAPRRSTHATTAVATRHEVVAVEQLSVKKPGPPGWAAQTRPQPGLWGCRVRADPLPARLQDHLVRHRIGDRAAVLCVESTLFALRKTKTKLRLARSHLTTAATDAHPCVGI